MDRDLVGYADNPPKVTWPGGAPVAISLVVNDEEGSENLLQDGIGKHETLGEGQSPLSLDRRDLALACPRCATEALMSPLEDGA